jgi:hypothetical protein
MCCDIVLNFYVIVLYVLLVIVTSFISSSLLTDIGSMECVYINVNVNVSISVTNPDPINFTEDIDTVFKNVNE